MASRTVDSIALRLGNLLATVAPGVAARGAGAPCFVIGCGRSGSTAIGELLRQHPQVAVFPSEGNRLWHPRLYPAVEATVDAPSFFADPREFTRISLEQRTPADDRRLEARLGGFRICRARPLLVNKSAMVQFMVPKILELFPDARLIHLVRDGRAVAYSYGIRLVRHAQGDVRSVREARSTRQGFVDLLTTLGRYWSDSLAEIEATRHLAGDRYLEMRYEDLCTEWEPSTATLARFLDIAPEPLASAAPFRSMNWKILDDLDETELQQVSAPMADWLLAKGYGTLDADRRPVSA